MIDTMTTQACTVAISFGLPRQSIELKQASAKLEVEAKAQSGTTRASIYYFRRKDPKDPKKVIDGLQSLKTFQGEWKRQLEHYARYPYVAGLKLCPAALVPQLLQVNDWFVNGKPGDPKWLSKSQVWENWADDIYPDLKDTAHERMGEYYNADDFPSLTDCLKRFTCEVLPVPLAAGEQWKHLSAIGGDITAALAESTDQKIQQAKKEAQVLMWKDMMGPLEHIVETLSKDSPRIYESLIGNVLNIVDIVPAFAFDADPQLVELASKAKEQLQNITTDQLRKSDEVRKATLETAKTLVNGFMPFARKLAV